MTREQLLMWSPLLMPLILLLNLIVSSGIAVLVYRFTRNQAQMEALKLINSRWQEINKIVIEKPQMQRLLHDAKFAKKSDEEIMAYNFLFQIVNVTYEIHFAATRGLIDSALADRFIAGNVSVLMHRRDDVLELLTWNRGYDAEFCQKLRGLLTIGQSEAPLAE